MTCIERLKRINISAADRMVGLLYRFDVQLLQFIKLRPQHYDDSELFSLINSRLDPYL